MASRVFIEDYGAVGDGVTNDLAAIQACVSANPRAVIACRTKGKFLISQSTVSDVIKLSAGQKFVGGGASLLNTGICCPIVVVANAPGASVRGWKFVHHASRTDAWTASNYRFQVLQDVIPADGVAELAWYGYNYATPDVLSQRGTRDLGALVYIGNSPGASVLSCVFTSDQPDERGFNRSGIFVDVDGDNTNAKDITIWDCDFYYCEHGTLACNFDRLLHSNNRGHVYWNIGPNAVADAGHHLYITGGASTTAPLPIGTDNVIEDVVDTGYAFINTGGTAPDDFYYEPTIKIRNQLRARITNINSTRAGGGLDMFSFRDCYVDGVLIDQRGQVANASTNAEGSAGLRLDRYTTNYPRGYTLDDFGFNTFKNITLFAVKVSMGDAYQHDFSIGGYDGTTPIHKGDVWTNFVVYAHNLDGTSANIQPSRFIINGGYVGTSDVPVYIGRVDTSLLWPNDFEVATLLFYCQFTTVYVGVDSGAGAFTAGHPPVFVADAGSGAGNIVNGSSFPAGSSLPFTTSVSPPA